MTPSNGSVTCWLTLLQAGDEQAAQELWNRYFPRLVRLAQCRLRVPGREADEEDVAISAFASFCRSAEAGRFPQLADRTDLWRLLVVITARKAADLIRRKQGPQHGGGKVRGDSAFALGSPEGDGQAEGIENVIGNEPTPDFAAQVREEYRRLLAALKDERLRTIAVWKLEAYTNRQIAEKLGCSVAAVERKLKRIRHIWRDHLP
jgi:RNA polymerase sigma factor (sigma-70 family)